MRQMERHTQVGAPEWDCAYRVARQLVERTPSIEKVRFFASGTDANLAAIRMARAYTGRTKIAKAIGSYHGTADVLLVGHSILRDADDYIPAGVPVHAADEVIEFPYNDPDAAESILEHASHDIAAILIEPCLTAAGMIEAERGFLQRLREVATRNGIVLIFDEVVTYPVAYGGAQVLFDNRRRSSCVCGWRTGAVDEPPRARRECRASTHEHHVHLRRQQPLDGRRCHYSAEAHAGSA
jgi:glutamate-1-semialdehyde 2,1-aminomutase